MAEIDIERKPRRSAWSWALGVLLLLVVAGIGWYFVAGPGSYESLWGPEDDPGVSAPAPGAPGQPPDATVPGGAPPRR